MEIELNAGAVTLATFHNVQARDALRLVQEFGAQPGDRTITKRIPPLVTINYTPVVPPRDGVYIGRSASIDGNFFYVNEGGGWVRVDLSGLLRCEEFEIAVDPGADLTRLLGYVVEPIAKVRGVLSGLLFVHSSSVVTTAGKGILLAAWGNTGKTNLMLQLLQDGCRFCSDDWSLVDENRNLHVYPRPVNLMNYNVAMFPELRKLMTRRKGFWYRVDDAFQPISRRLRTHGGTVLRMSELFSRALEAMANARIPVSQFVLPSEQTFDPLALAVDVYKRAPGRSLLVEKISVQQFAQRITACFLYENTRFLQRLSEYASVGKLEHLDQSGWTARYCQLALSYFRRVSGEEVLSVGIPADASRRDFAVASTAILEITDSELSR